MSGLGRFLDAQSSVLESVERELTEGRKATHWIWFVFPQIAGLGMSEMSKRYAIANIAEAEAYLAHPVLSDRLSRHVRLTMSHTNLSALSIFGSVDELKFHASLTLFSRASDDQALFGDALEQFFDGFPHRLTLDVIGEFE